jgi:hypothetical protein
MGYKYGTIGKRDVLVLREDIVASRGKYLRPDRLNDALKDAALPVVYTNETWTYPFYRPAKGWFPRCRFRRGQIVLAAGKRKQNIFEVH